ncbi:MAG TPA: iron-sulfur cluster insertion protein ErpA, partial [Acidimicrobiia bacterium]|nr:iron-sulfur cluster insertion protein ErpA [Acidimicrobiia bacterium]
MSLTIKSSRPTPVVALTDTAAEKVAELIAAEGEPSLALRVAVRAGGCSGFSYE